MNEFGESNNFDFGIYLVNLFFYFISFLLFSLNDDTSEFIGSLIFIVWSLIVAFGKPFYQLSKTAKWIVWISIFLISGFLASLIN